MTENKGTDSEPAAGAAQPGTPIAPCELDGSAHGPSAAPDLIEVGQDLNDVGQVQTRAAGPGAPTGHPGQPGRSADGRWTYGNEGHWLHGGRSRKPLQDDPRRQTIVDDMMRERGGAEVLDVVTRLRIQEFAFLSVQLADVNSYLEEVGLQTVNGKVRQGSINASLDLSARRERIAALLAGETPAPDGDAPDLTNESDDMLIARLELLLNEARATRDAARQEASAPVLVTNPPTPAPVLPEPEVSELQCPWCHRAPCIGRDHHAYDVLHSEDPEHIERRRQLATQEMYESLRRQRRGY